nr:E3 ubiquitin-protein ligase KCMF1-like [Vicugna pacos]
MSRHEGVSCDACLKGNFRGHRYKCLICYNYDLCASCYESGARTTRHTTDHPMQCILTRVDFDLYYGGEAFSVEQPQAFTCPYCGKMGYTETSLQEHVTSEHAETSTEVICPICAALPGSDPKHVTDDFAAHLTLEHRAPRDLYELIGVRHVRRMSHPGRGLGGPRARRSNMYFTSSSARGLSSSQSSYSPSSPEAMDPIAELLPQLSGVRRSAGGQLNSSGPSASQLQQLQMQLQLERQHAQAARQQLETALNASLRSNASSVTTAVTQSTATASTANTESSQQALQNSQFLLTRFSLLNVRYFVSAGEQKDDRHYPCVYDFILYDSQDPHPDVCLLTSAADTASNARKKEEVNNARGKEADLKVGSANVCRFQ